MTALSSTRFLRPRSLAPLFALTIVVGCSADTSTPPSAGVSLSPARRHPPPEVPPQIPDVSELDVDGDRVDDRFAVENEAIHRYLSRDVATFVLDAPVPVQALFDAPVGDPERAAFEREGGAIRHVFKHLSYGFTGSLPRRALARTAKRLGPHLLLLHAETVFERHLDEATRTGRVRPVWASSFQGGYSGASTIAIAIVDSGVDESHPDLTGRMVGFKDYTCFSNDAACATESFGKDFDGHGTHVAGIAVGSGAAFGVGPGALEYTTTDDLTGEPENTFYLSSVHLPPDTNVTSTATWLGGGTGNLVLLGRTDGAPSGTTWKLVGTATGTSPLSLSFTGTIAAGLHHTVALRQNSAQSIRRYAITNRVTNYPAVGDGFNALRGVAAGSSWFGAKIFPTSDTGALSTTTDIVEAMDDIIDKRVELDIKIANMSFGVAGGKPDSTQRAQANTMVDNGIVVVASAGNNGADTATGDPGRAAKVITVGAANDQNALTSYTSGGIGSSEVNDTTDVKPDLLAPGGSSFRSRILSVDSNQSDAEDPSFADRRADDYAQLQGTSMAAPFVAGSAALLIQALEKAGTAWSFDSSAAPLRVKMLLLASSTETNQMREQASTGPELGRSLQPKDRFEGYGIINPDAAIEAATITYDLSSFSGSTSGSTTDRRAWGRKIVVPAGRTLGLTLDVPSTADFDVYVYAAAPDAKGNPVLLSHGGDGAGLDVDEVATTPSFSVATTVHAFVKRIAGSGSFTLRGATFVCGDGHVEQGEDCDVGANVAGDCCSAACQFEAPGFACGDGGSCASSGSCGPYFDPDAGEPDGGTDASRSDASVIIDDTTAPPGVSDNEATIGGGGGSCASSSAPTGAASSFGAAIGLLALARRRPRRPYAWRVLRSLLPCRSARPPRR